MIRLYRAVCGWLEASTRAMEREDEPFPEGGGAAHVEHAHSYTTEPELHNGWRPIGFEIEDKRK
jgi:hypothetical protein